MSDRRSIPDMNQGLADLYELVSLAEQLDRNVLVELGQLIRSGTPLLAAHVDPVPASLTSDVVVLYKVTDQVQAYLTALRSKARDGSTGKVVSGCSHDDSLQTGEDYSATTTGPPREADV
jgi:hypothetical protein